MSVKVPTLNSLMYQPQWLLRYRYCCSDNRQKPKTYFLVQNCQ